MWAQIVTITSDEEVNIPKGNREQKTEKIIWDTQSKYHHAINQGSDNVKYWDAAIIWITAALMITAGILYKKIEQSKKDDDKVGDINVEENNFIVDSSWKLVENEAHKKIKVS